MRVLVAHPGQLRLIYRSKNKNDRKDAERLAKLLYLGGEWSRYTPFHSSVCANRSESAPARDDLRQALVSDVAAPRNSVR